MNLQAGRGGRSAPHPVEIPLLSHLSVVNLSCILQRRRKQPTLSTLTFLSVSAQSEHQGHTPFRIPGRLFSNTSPAAPDIPHLSSRSTLSLPSLKNTASYHGNTALRPPDKKARTASAFLQHTDTAAGPAPVIRTIGAPCILMCICFCFHIFLTVLKARCCSEQKYRKHWYFHQFR